MGKFKVNYDLMQVSKQLVKVIATFLSKNLIKASHQNLLVGQFGTSTIEIVLKN